MFLLIQQKRENFVAHSPNVNGDADVISQLKMDALYFSMKMKMVRQDLDLPVTEEATTSPTFDLGKTQDVQQTEEASAHDQNLEMKEDTIIQGIQIP